MQSDDIRFESKNAFLGNVFGLTRALSQTPMEMKKWISLSRCGKCSWKFTSETIQLALTCLRWWTFAFMCCAGEEKFQSPVILNLTHSSWRREENRLERRNQSRTYKAITTQLPKKLNSRKMRGKSPPTLASSFTLMLIKKRLRWLVLFYDFTWKFSELLSRLNEAFIRNKVMHRCIKGKKCKKFFLINIETRNLCNGPQGSLKINRQPFAQWTTAESFNLSLKTSYSEISKNMGQCWFA